MMQFRRMALILAAVFMATIGSTCVVAEELPLRVAFLSGCPTYHSEKSLPPFEQWLEANYAIQCRHLSRDGHAFPGLDQLAEADVAFVFFKRINLEGAQLEAFQRHVRSGKPLVAVRTASHAVQTWLAFDKEILGGNYQGHYEKDPDTVIEVTPAGKNHPVLKDLRLKSAPGPLYKNSGHAEDIQILLTGSNPGQVEPLAWTREINGGRVFYTSLGNLETFEDAQFRKLLAQAIFWTARRQPTVQK